MIILKILWAIVRTVLKIIISILQVILTVLAVGFGFAGGIFKLIGNLLGGLFIVGSLLSLMFGIMTVKEFWPMFLTGVAFGAIPNVITMYGQGAICTVKEILYKL